MSLDIYVNFKKNKMIKSEEVASNQKQLEGCYIHKRNSIQEETILESSKINFKILSMNPKFNERLEKKSIVTKELEDENKVKMSGELIKVNINRRKF